MSRSRALTILALIIMATPAVEATQHLVRPGESWEVIDGRLKPGDEVILMPGRHKPATLRNARGTGEMPVTIRGLDPENPPVIEANRYGLRLYAPLHLRIADLEITGATINGILMDGSAASGADTETAVEDPEDRSTTGSVTLENVAVTANGPQGTPGQRHAIHLRYLSDIEINACRVEGWVGTGLEIVGCRGVQVVKSEFKGLPEYVQSSGIRVRAGSERVRIQTTHFQDAGDQGISIGAGSKLEEFAALEEEPPEPLYEAARVQVRRCVFERSLCAVAFVNAERSFMRHCTIVRPQRAVISVRQEQKDPRFGGIHRCSFGSNVVTWEPGDIKMITHVGPGADATKLQLEQNVWWSSDLATTLEALGGFTGAQAFPQITDVDPKLGEGFRPTVETAASFGADLD